MIDYQKLVIKLKWGLEHNWHKEHILNAIYSVDANHIASKTFLADNLLQWLPAVNAKNKKMFVAGGWTGLLAQCLHDRYNCHIISMDLEEKWPEYGRFLFPKIKFEVGDCFDFVQPCDVWASTSCEHFHREELVHEIQKRKGECIFALQSNNWYNWPTHINCVDSLDDFIDYLGLDKVLFSASQPMHIEGIERFTVIGV